MNKIPLPKNIEKLSLKEKIEAIATILAGIIAVMVVWVLLELIK